MASVSLGRAGRDVLIDLDVCAKTGRATGERVLLRGTTTPAWVDVLLLFTVVGFVLAQTMTSQSFRITLPFVHTAHRRWVRTRRLAWAAGLGGVASLLAAATDQSPSAAWWWGVGLVLIAAAIVGGAANTLVHGLVVRSTRDGDLVLTRAHPAFAEAVAGATVEAGRAAYDV